MTRIALVRHGETELNSGGRIQGESEHGLNDRGRAQARRIGALLRASTLSDTGQPRAEQSRAEQPMPSRQEVWPSASMWGRGGWNALVSSPQRRARETAAEIGVELGLPPCAAVDELCERRYGAAEGLTFEQLFDRWHVPDERRRQGFTLDWLIADGRIPGAEPIESVRARGLRALDLIEAQNASGSAVVAVAHGTLIRCTLEAIDHDAPLHLENGGGVVLDRMRTGGWRVVEQIGGSSVH